ncbi:hypothetical protein F5884DRAFT_860134 [Xylogone sp. PMI_703]|nr:hypothetical protein F5884DRAFT_860134 [Xylogone sp. PMI_703]
MAGARNGKAVDTARKGSNGHVMTTRAKDAPRKRRWSLFSIITRLSVWYSIITILFWCPATPDLLDKSSPRVCKAYFDLKSIAAPHLQPIYDTHAAPYVNAIWPYYDAADRTVITPVKTLSIKYGAPRLAQAQAFGQNQWKKNVQPHVQKYQAIAMDKYDEVLAPHVNTAVSTASPYYEIVKTNALQTYYELILPAYITVQPYALQGYDIAKDFTVQTAIPYGQWAWTNGNIFLSRTVWPRLRILYGENVEPQLVRIGERLGRYRDGKKIEAAAHDVDSAALFADISSTASSVSSGYAASVPPVAKSSSGVSITQADGPVQTSTEETETRLKAREIVQRDLQVWQEKFVKAADEGSEELEERINEITERLIKNQAQGVGKAHIVQLEETVKSSLNGLKNNIISIVENSTGKEDTEAEEKINNAIRKAGVAIKDKAQAIRAWKQSYDKEAKYLIDKAIEDALVILDHIGDIGIQEIGMRWAWTDGVTHRDWQKYHALKPKFDEWRNEVGDTARANPGIEAAAAAGAEIEEQAMSIAGSSATELARLRDVAKWKLANHDTSDDFSTKIIPSIVAAAQDKVHSVESVVSSVVADAASAMSSMVVGESHSASENIASSATESPSSQASVIDSKTVATEIVETTETVSPVPLPPVEEAISIESEPSPKIAGTGEETPGVLEQASSVAESAASLSEPLSEEVGASISSAIGSASPVDPAEYTTVSPVDVASTLDSVKEFVGTVGGKVEEAASSVSSVETAATSSVKDEL